MFPLRTKARMLKDSSYRTPYIVACHLAPATRFCADEAVAEAREWPFSRVENGGIH